MIFKDEKHEQRFYEFLGRMKSSDCYHSALAYLLALDENIRDDPKRISDCFNFEKDAINPDVFRNGWITGFDRRLLTLAFHLWNEGNEANMSDIFGYGDLEYMLEAVRIRFS